MKKKFKENLILFLKNILYLQNVFLAKKEL